MEKFSKWRVMWTIDYISSFGDSSHNIIIIIIRMQERESNHSYLPRYESVQCAMHTHWTQYINLQAPSVDPSLLTRLACVLKDYLTGPLLAIVKLGLAILLGLMAEGLKSAGKLVNLPSFLPT
jgi:hypothetical protein